MQRSRNKLNTSVQQQFHQHLGLQSLSYHCWTIWFDCQAKQIALMFAGLAVKMTLQDTRSTYSLPAKSRLNLYLAGQLFSSTIFFCDLALVADIVYIFVYVSSLLAFDSSIEFLGTANLLSVRHPCCCTTCPHLEFKSLGLQCLHFSFRLLI